MEIERRAYPIHELRMDEVEGGGWRIAGMAAVFNATSEDLGGFREMIAPGAFAKTLQESDIRALFNHDSNFVIGRNRAGTLRLAETEAGLSIEADLPPTTWAADLRESMARGDIDQMSFGFRAVRDEWPEMGKLRVLREVRLYDVSVVTFPAYPQTSVGLRSMGDVLQAIRAGVMTEDELRQLAQMLQAQNGGGATPSVDAHLAQLKFLRGKLAMV